MYDDLTIKAKKLRQDTFNAFIKHGEAHLGGSFSMIEMLIALYEVILTGDDKFILSKAHASFPLCLLLKDKGYHPKLTTHLEIDIENDIHSWTWITNWHWYGHGSKAFGASGENFCYDQ